MEHTFFMLFVTFMLLNKLAPPFIHTDTLRAQNADDTNTIDNYFTTVYVGNQTLSGESKTIYTYYQPMKYETTNIYIDVMYTK